MSRPRKTRPKPKFNINLGAISHRINERTTNIGPIRSNVYFYIMSNLTFTGAYPTESNFINDPPLKEFLIDYYLHPDFSQEFKMEK